MGVINTSHFSWDLLPTAKRWYGLQYKELPVQFSQIFDKGTSKYGYEEEAGVTGFGYARQKTQGYGISYGDSRQTFLARYIHIVYELGFMITREMNDDGIAIKKVISNAKALAFSLRQTKEVLAANILNRAFTAAYTMGSLHDGKEMCATDHPNVSGGSWSNEYSGGADLSEYALEQALIDIANFKTDKGMKIAIQAQKLIIPPALESDAVRLLMSDGRVGTDWNDVNYIKKTGKFPGGYVVNNYLDDADAWFIKTNCPDGIKYFERDADEFDSDNDFDTENAKFKGRFRCSFGWTDPRGIYGSAGA